MRMTFRIVFVGVCIWVFTSNLSLAGGWKDMVQEAKSMAKQTQQATKRFSEGYKKSSGHTGDKLIEGMIESVTPEADEGIRRVQRNAIKMMVDPNQERSMQHYSNMQDSVSDYMSNGGSSYGNNSNSYRENGSHKRNDYYGGSNEKNLRTYNGLTNTTAVIVSGVPDGNFCAFRQKDWFPRNKYSYKRACNSAFSAYCAGNFGVASESCNYLKSDGQAISCSVCEKF